MKTFEKLYMREEGLELYSKLHKHFLEEEFKDELFKEKMLKSILGIVLSISRGYERSLRNVTECLYESKGFVGEVKTLAYLGKALSYFNDSECEDIVNRAGKIAAGLHKIITIKQEKKSQENETTD